MPATRRPATTGIRRLEPMPAAATRTESLRLKLEEDILNGQLKPGAKLDEEALAARFGVSRTPVRDAIKALSATSLVEWRPHHGAHVARPTLKAILEIVEMMLVLEVSCAEMAARRHSLEDRHRITIAQDAAETARSLAGPARFYAANTRFHDAIYQASGNSFLMAQTQALRQRLEPYRRGIVYGSAEIEKANREHRAIMQALFSGDTAETGRRMREHLSSIQTGIATMVEKATAAGL